MELENLKIKLEHWSEHNKSHAAGYRKQADEAGNMGMHEVKDELLSAVEDLDNAGCHLEKALEKL
ncbi:MAG: hypothetical protein K8R08_00090 [Methanosarcinales archaeon]|nr:hypothetical protein [Methanosarcinales archaeon]